VVGGGVCSDDEERGRSWFGVRGDKAFLCYVIDAIMNA